MFKKIFFVLVLALIPLYSQAQNIPELYFFYSESCPHCHKESIFLDTLETEYANDLKINRLEISNAENLSLMLKMAADLDATVSGVPFTVIGDQYFIGYYNDQVTGEEIRSSINNLLKAQVNNIAAPVKPVIPPELNGLEGVQEPANDLTSDQNKNSSEISSNLFVPILGDINTKQVSLPILSIVLGFLDGFNPCAMWALIFLISLLLGMENKKRMWILGTTFIVTSAFVYFLFMAAWLNIFLFLGLVLWLRLSIATIALAGGAYNIREFFKNKAGTCKLDGQAKKKRVFDKLKSISEQKSFFLAFIGIILLALAVNMVELICSAGLPAVYTQILALNDLNTWQYYSYILLYIFFFMLDDLLVFFTAMITLQLTGFGTKYSRYSSLVGGILMFIIGLLLLFKYEWLTFV
ncbi:MAG: hypothetical protein WCS88_02210 [Patescibacteria group bacterium]|jgi:thiol-disulfide isomerase/thioredoxin